MKWLTTIGSQFYVLRTRLVQELIPYIKTYYAELCVGKEEVSIAYIPSWLKYEDPSLQELLDSQFSRDEVKEQLDTVIEREFSREHQRRLSLSASCRPDRISYQWQRCKPFCEPRPATIARFEL